MRTRQKLIITGVVTGILVAGSAGIAAFAGTLTDDSGKGTVQKIAPVVTGVTDTPNPTDQAVDQKFAVGPDTSGTDSSGTNSSGTDSAQDQAELAARVAAAAAAAAANPNASVGSPTSVPAAPPTYLDDHGGDRSGTDDADGHSGSSQSGSDDGSGHH